MKICDFQFTHSNLKQLKGSILHSDWKFIPFILFFPIFHPCVEDYLHHRTTQAIFMLNLFHDLHMWNVHSCHMAMAGKGRRKQRENLQFSSQQRSDISIQTWLNNFIIFFHSHFIQVDGWEVRSKNKKKSTKSDKANFQRITNIFLFFNIQQQQ